jgi:cell division protein FtsX
MKSVSFTFHEQASEQNQDRLRAELLDLPDVHHVGRIKPDATKPALRRMWFAEVVDDEAAASLVQRLRGHDDIQSVNIPSDRGLL